MIRRALVKLWGLVLLVAAGYLWNLRGPRLSMGWKIGTVVCLLLLIIGLLAALGVFR